MKCLICRSRLRMAQKRMELTAKRVKSVSYTHLKERFCKLLDDDMNMKIMSSSMLWLTKLLEKHFNRKVVILIDEYDVPLAKAYENGFYDEMVLLIRNIFGNVLKTNESLAFAVLTGCLRLSLIHIYP